MQKHTRAVRFWISKKNLPYFVVSVDLFIYCSLCSPLPGQGLFLCFLFLTSLNRYSVHSPSGGYICTWSESIVNFWDFHAQTYLRVKRGKQQENAGADFTEWQLKDKCETDTCAFSLMSSSLHVCRHTATSWRIADQNNYQSFTLWLELVCFSQLCELQLVKLRRRTLNELCRWSLESVTLLCSKHLMSLCLKLIFLRTGVSNVRPVGHILEIISDVNY